MALHWYTLHTKPRKEESVWQQVQNHGIEVFYPRLRVNPVNPRSRKLKPYFPRYLFVHVDLEAVGVSTFAWMPHTLGLVNFGGEPAQVPENLIIAIKKRVEDIASSGGEVFDGLKQGDLVKINYGPFDGYEAIFDTRLTGSERVRVLLKFLDFRQVPVEMAASNIKRV